MLRKVEMWSSRTRCEESNLELVACDHKLTTKASFSARSKYIA
jgi:hypothetical protein